MKVMVIGAGRNKNGIGQYIARYFHLGGFQVAAVLGTKEETARRASLSLKDYGIAANHYTDFYRMVMSEQPDIAVIASPSLTHYDYLQRCLDAGLHIFCEKPFFWKAPADLKETEAVKNIFRRAKEKKLTLAMDSQLPFALADYEKLCGPIQIGNTNEFFVKMSPSLEQGEMIPEAIPHPLSILYSVFGEGEISELSFESAGERQLTIKFNYQGEKGLCKTSVELTTQKEPPREFAFGFNGKIVTRDIDITGYDIYFNYGAERLKITDPLELSVKDFIKSVTQKTEPLIGRRHILNNMYLLKKIYTGYENIKESLYGETEGTRA